MQVAGRGGEAGQSDPRVTAPLPRTFGPAVPGGSATDTNRQAVPAQPRRPWASSHAAHDSGCNCYYSPPQTDMTTVGTVGEEG